MAITPEMKEQMNHEYEVRQRYKRASRQKELALPELARKQAGDTRVIIEFRAGESQEEMDTYQNAYLSGKPAQREPYIKEFFDYLVNYRLDTSLTNKEAVEQNIIPLYEARGKFCYAKNLLDDNSQYFEEFYSPNDFRRLSITQDYFTATTPAMDLILADNGYDTNLNNKPPKIRTNKNYQAQLLAQSADFLYNQSIAALEEKPLDSIFNIKVPPDAGQTIFALDKLLKNNQLKTNSPSCARANDIFDNIFVIPFESGCQKEERTAMKTDMFDMIYIDGKSAEEKFSRKYPAGTPGREMLIKAEVVNAMASGKNRVELATIQRNEHNQPKLVINEVKPDLRAIEPTIKQDYSRIRRAFNFGPFKLKTRTEKINDLLGSDKDKSKRQASIAKKLENGLNTLKEEAAAKEKQQNLIMEAKNEKAHNIMKEKPLLDINDRAYFGKIDWPEDSKDDYTQFFINHDPEFSELVQTLPRITSRRSFVDLVMLSKGYSIDDLLNNQTDKYKEDLANAGKEAVDLLKEKNVDKLAEIFVKGGEAIIKTPIPIVNPNDPEAIANSYDFSNRYANLCKDWEQLRKPALKEAIRRLDGPENSKKLAAAIVFSGACQHQVRTVGDFYRNGDRCKPDSEYDLNCTTGMIAKIGLNNFCSFSKTKELNTWNMSLEEINNNGYALTACTEGATSFVMEQNELLSKGTAPLMTSYMRGTGPNPLHIDQKGNILQEKRVIKTINETINADKLWKENNRKAKQASKPGPAKSNQVSKTQEEPKKQTDVRERRR